MYERSFSHVIYCYDRKKVNNAMRSEKSKKLIFTVDKRV